EVICTLNDPRVPELAERLGTTRSAAALELWRDRLDGSVVAIGNAPTALFRLLELVAEGADRPAAVLGIPVGFVGAGESKLALAAVGDERECSASAPLPRAAESPGAAQSARWARSGMCAAEILGFAGGWSKKTLRSMRSISPPRP